LSEEFAKKIGLLKDKRVSNLIVSIKKKKGAASMNMLGNSVLVQFHLKDPKN